MKRKKHVWNIRILALLTAAGTAGLWGCARGGGQSALLQEKWQQDGQENGVIFGGLEITLPEGAAADVHEGKKTEEETDAAYQIPQELLDLIGRAFEEGTAYEWIGGLRIDRELSKEEVLELGEASPWIHAELAEMRNVYVGPLKGGFAVLEADLDNDGVLDLLMGRDEGGSGGFFSYVLFKGKADGTYERTSQVERVREEFCVLSFEGKNYLWLTTWDYGRKLYNGADLYYYENGELVEQASVRMVPESCEVNVEECQGEQWRALAEQAAAAGSEYQELARLGKSRKWTGSAERQAAGDDNQTYLCDLNNDGTEEQYQKAVWLSSNIYTEDGLQDYRGCRNRHSAAQRNAGVKGPAKPERKGL